MQDRKNNLFISSFRKEHRFFLKWTLIFFIPVVVSCVLLELLVLNMPLNYVITSTYFNSEKDDIEILALGPSQINGGINPEYFDKKAINLSSASQHHNLDFKILSQLKDRLPKLSYVILELSYSHLEQPHNSKEFWKNSVYLKYYDVNAFERNVYFKDKFIYLARPDVYSKLLYEYYLTENKGPHLNKFGFDTSNFDGLFKRLDYNANAIDTTKFEINTRPNEVLFKYNTNFLFEMLAYSASENLKVVLCTMPLYKTYLAKRNPEMLRRRDSILNVISLKYSNVRIFNKEADTIQFKISDFNNHNHLNPRGAEKFTKSLNTFINTQF